MRELDSQEHGRRGRNFATGTRIFVRNLGNSLIAAVREGARLAFRLAAERCRQNAIRALRNVDDRMLADIGVPRGTFELALSAPAA